MADSLDLDPQRLAIVNFAPQERCQELVSALRAAGYDVSVVDGEGVTDKVSFLHQAQRDLPQVENPGPGNWDAYADYLRSALGHRPGQRIALVWSHVERMLDGGLADLLTAVEVTARVFGEAEMGNAGWPAVETANLFLVGTGPNFLFRSA